MAITVWGLGESWISTNQGAHTTVYQLGANWLGNLTPYDIINRNFNYTGGGWTYSVITNAQTGSWNTSFTTNPTLAADTNITWNAYLNTVEEGTATTNGPPFKSRAVTATTSTPSSSAITGNSATIACNYFPNVNASSCSAQLQYKKTTDVTWSDAGSPGTTGGYAEVNISRNITGLSSLTQYQARLVITRGTVNDTSLTSATHSFTTLAGEPLVTTDAATSVAATSATLNLTLDINEGTGVTVYWKWGTDNPPTQNTTASQNAAADGSFSAGISGLTASTTYYAQAYTEFSTPSGSPNNGSVVQFMTAADPAVEAASEDHMHIYEFNNGIYGAAKTVYFTLQSPAATSSDRLVTTAPGSLFAAGDVKVSKDGGAFANAANSVAQVAASNPLYSLQLSATEMQATDIVVQIVDQDGPAFRDALIVVHTKLQLGQMQVDASNLTNTTAATFTGIGSGHGISAVGGATGLDIDGVLGQHVLRFNTAQAGAASTITLDASASATNDYYNGALVMLIGGTGAGQGRTITDYVGGTKVATVNKSWATNPDATSVFVLVPGDDPWEIAPGAELAALPTYSSSFAKMLQFIFQRFVYRRTQTATVFTMYKDDGSTSFATAAVSDDGTTQSHAELS